MFFELKICIKTNLSIEDFINVLNRNKEKVKYTEINFFENKVSIYSDLKNGEKLPSITFFEGAFKAEDNGVELIGKVAYFKYFKIAFWIIFIFGILSIIKTFYVLPAILTILTTMMILIIYLQLEKRRYFNLIHFLMNIKMD